MKNIKYILLFIVATVMPQMVWAGRYAGVPDGDGSISNPYLIGDAKELAWFRDRVNNDNYNSRIFYAELINDIDLSSECSETLVKSWTPIGVLDTRDGFLGHFDGKNHVITGLYIHNGLKYQGLFGVNNGTIKNLGVDGTVHIYGGYCSGAICGGNNGTISNCYSKANVSGNNNVGGIAGRNDGTIENCYNMGAVKADATESSIEAGGICGTNENTVRYCYNLASVTANYYAGGICGNNNYNNITYCFSIGALIGYANMANYSEEITMAQVSSGELAYKLNQGLTDGTQTWYQKLGEDGDAYPVFVASGNQDDTVYGFYLHGANTLSYSNNADDVKHTVAYNAEGRDEAHGNHNDSYKTTGWIWTDSEDLTSATATITYICKLCGDVHTPVITVTNDEERPNIAASCGVEGHNYYVATGTLGNRTISDKHEQVLAAYPLHAHFDEYGFCDVCHRYFLTPELGEDGYYQLVLPGHLHWFAQFVNTHDEENDTYPNVNANARMMNDIDAMCSEDFQWTPIAARFTGGVGGSSEYAYTGVFDGNGKAITNIYMYGTMFMSGLFGHINHEGVVKNLTIKNSTFKEISGGAFAGQCYGSIIGCTNYASMELSEMSGGIVGYVYHNAKIVDCTNFGDITSNSSQIGGIVGEMQADSQDMGIIYSCTNKGKIVGTYKVGGIAGEIVGNDMSYDKIIVQDCENYGSIHSSKIYVGGIIGLNEFATVYNCMNMGDITSEDTNVGGLVGCSFQCYKGEGTLAHYKNCYNAGNVSTTYSNARIGGIVGLTQNIHVFENIYNIGKVSCPSNKESGTFIGNFQTGGTLKNCFALEQEEVKFNGDIGNTSTADAVSGTKTAEEFASGEIAWIFNNYSDSEPVWYQSIGVDAAPILVKSPFAIVHNDGSKYYNDMENISSLDIVDGTNYNAPLARTVTELSYSHSFDNSGAWYSYYVPFQMPVAELTGNGVKVAYINGIHQYDDDEDGTIDRTDLEVFYAKNGTLRAGYPYLVKTANEADVNISLSDVTLQPSVSNTINLSTAVADYYITGTYSGVSAQDVAANHWLAVGMDAQGKSAIVAPSNSIRPQRWYLSIDEKDSPYIKGAASVKTFRIVAVGEEDLETGIRTMYSVPVTDGVFDITGRHLAQPQKGINIINGKKVFIK